jgi:hypothetical protein
MSLQHMPVEVTAHILRYVGNAGDLLRCEKTCKTLRRILHDDAVWSSSPGGSRANACHVRGCRKVRKYQKSGESILFEVLGVGRWKSLVTTALHVFFIEDVCPNDHHIFLRGDTSAVLMELVENFAIVQLQRAGVVMNASTPAESQIYPTLTVRHWEAQNELHSAFVPSPNSIYTPLFAGVSTSPIPRDAMLPLTNMLGPGPGTTMITTIIRRLAYRAGIIKMEDDVFDLAWASLVCSIVALLRPACIQLIDASSLRTTNSKKIICVAEGETMYTVPPYTSSSFCEDCGEVHGALHTPVPGQIEAAARSLSIPFKVYGDVWHCMPDSTEEDERANAESEYAFLDEDDDKMMEG